MKLSRITLGLLLVLVFSALVRLTPSIYTKMPFSNDVWPLIDISKTSLLEGRIPGEDRGGHHVNWPASIILAVFYSTLTGFDLVVFYQYIGVLVISASTATLFYAMVRRSTNNKFISVLATLGLTLLPSYVLYTSAYLKESFAHCVLLLCTYLLLRTHDRLHLVLVLAVYMSMIVSHPLTSFMFTALIASQSYMLIARCAKWRVCGEPLAVKYLLYINVMALALYVLYNFVYVKPPVTLELNDVPVLSSYGILVYASQVLLPTTSILFLTVLFSAVLGVHVYRATSAPLNELVFIFVIPFVIILASLIREVKTTDRVERGLYILWSYTLPVTTVALYIITYAPYLLGILHRFLNYLAYTFSFSLASLATSKKRFTVMIAIVFSVSTTLSSIACTLNLVPYVYYWRYTREDAVFASFLEYLNAGIAMEGDPKYSYMVRVVKPVSIETLTDICNSRTLVAIPVEALLYGLPITPVDYVRLDYDVFTCGNLVYNSKRAFLVEFD